MAGIQFVTLYQVDRSPHAQELRSQLAQHLEATVGAPDEGGMLELELTADSHEEGLARVRDALAALGADDHFTFPASTGTGFHPPEDRSDPPPDDDEEFVDETRRPSWLEDRAEPSRPAPADDDLGQGMNDLPGPDPEPPHLERGSPREDDPAPSEPPPRDIP